MCSVKDKSVILCSFLTIFIHGHLLVLNQAFIDSQEVVLLKRNIRSLYETGNGRRSPLCSRCALPCLLQSHQAEGSQWEQAVRALLTHCFREGLVTLHYSPHPPTAEIQVGLTVSNNGYGPSWYDLSQMLLFSYVSSTCNGQKVFRAQVQPPGWCCLAVKSLGLVLPSTLWPQPSASSCIKLSSWRAPASQSCCEEWMR